MSLPEPRPRRPSWVEVRPILVQVPQQPRATWQVDAVQAPGSRRAGARHETPWVVLIVDRDTGVALGLDAFASKPEPADVWDCLVATMRKPECGDPCRPARVEVRQKTLAGAWRSKLQQIDIECAVGHVWDAIDFIRDRLPKAHIDVTAGEPQAAASDDTDLREFPIEPGDIWQADVRRLPAWIHEPERAVPYRPWIAMVVSRTHDVVLAYNLVADRPPASWLRETVARAIRAPMMNQPHRPGRIEVSSAEQRDAMSSCTGHAEIECNVVERVETLDMALVGMARAMADEHTPPPLLEVPGMTRDQAAGFYAAAAAFFGCKPWQRVPGDTPIKIECDKFQSGPWHAVVMGQSGMQYGLAVHEDEQNLRKMLLDSGEDEDSSWSMSALTMLFSKMWEIPALDLDAAERHGWPVAGPEAYPLVLRVNPGHAIRPPLVWELELLEGCLRAIPEFLTGTQAALSTCVPVVSGKLTLRLSWVAWAHP